jgi:AraC-like DNA-binding protein
MDNGVKFAFEMRPSDSPFVEAVWHTESEESGTFMSVAGIKWQIVVMKQYGKTVFTVRGPETKASLAGCPENAEFYGINFNLGVFMPRLPTSELVNVGLDLPEASNNAVWFHGSAWEVPDFENADTFVERLIRDELLVHDPVVDATLQGHAQELSQRSVQRRFLRATGLTYGELAQIERAQQALALLERGTSILDTVDHVGYADQPHLTRSLKRFVGRTPAEILRAVGLAGPAR